MVGARSPKVELKGQEVILKADIATVQMNLGFGECGYSASWRQAK
jgi:hypothetical protein